MRRWNGWGDEGVSYPVPERGRKWLADELGLGSSPSDASLPALLATIPRSRLPDHPLIQVDPEARLRHARGQSLPDWIDLRFGRVQTIPDGVAFLKDENEVRTLLDLASQQGFVVIPFGGGTSVVGHVNPPASDRPVISLDLSRMDHMLEIDQASRLATLQAGASGRRVEAQLNAHDLTLGHFPQSWEYSTLGGWIATRSTGQQSLHYGRIEDLFAGGRLETPTGRLDLPVFPASAAGPDLRHWVLGSEGRMGVITRATVRVQPRPAIERFSAAMLPGWEAGLAAAQAIAQGDVGLSMLRLSDARETQISLLMAGSDRFAGLADRGLSLLGKGSGRCLAVYAVTGERPQAARAGRAARSILRRFEGLPLGTSVGERWRRDRFRSPYLRNSLWSLGYALDTLETALAWRAVHDAEQEVRSALTEGLMGEGERVLVLAHLSHLYPDGASLYFTFLYRLADDPDQTLDRWHRLKVAASEAILSCGGTISHQHGVGTDHAPYLVREKGARGMQLFRSALQAMDPQGIMNPGKLMLDDS